MALSTKQEKFVRGLHEQGLDIQPGDRVNGYDILNVYPASRFTFLDVECQRSDRIRKTVTGKPKKCVVRLLQDDPGPRTIIKHKRQMKQLYIIKHPRQLAAREQVNRMIRAQASLVHERGYQ
jgi:hypothetical protein